MSRSFKKSKIVKDSTKGMKRLANHRVRSYFKSGKEISSGKSYRKVFCSYDISDYKFICSDNCNICEKDNCCFKKK